MKFPGNRRLRQIKQALFPAAAELEAERRADVGALEAAVEARRNAVAALRQGCAERIRPYLGGLFVVTNFKWLELEENANRVSAAVLASANVGDTAPIGIVPVIGGSGENYGELAKTATALKDSFARSIGERAFLGRPEDDGPDFWLLSLARAAEGVARVAELRPHQVGCVAVVSAVDLYYQRDGLGVLAPATALRLTGISPTSHLQWEVISANPNEF